MVFVNADVSLSSINFKWPLPKFKRINLLVLLVLSIQDVTVRNILEKTGHFVSIRL
jgi:hypothetical protein